MVLLSHLRPEDVIRYELESFLPGKNNPFVPAYYTIDREKGLVEVGFLGNVGRARYISPVLGCVTDTEPESNDAVLPPGVAKAFVKPIEYVSPTFGNATLCNKDERVRMTKDRVAALQRVLDEEIAAADQYGGPHTRALVVLHCGKVRSHNNQQRAAKQPLLMSSLSRHHRLSMPEADRRGLCRGS